MERVEQNCCKYVKRVAGEGVSGESAVVGVPTGAPSFRTTVVAYFLLVSVKNAAAEALNVSLLFSVMPQAKGYYPTYAPL
jgi:hypothetical protein